MWLIGVGTEVCRKVALQEQGWRPLANVFANAKCLHQGFSTLVLEVHFPAGFISNPNQTHLNKLIKVFKITITLQACECKGQSRESLVYTFKKSCLHLYKCCRHLRPTVYTLRCTACSFANAAYTFRKAAYTLKTCLLHLYKL